MPLGMLHKKRYFIFQIYSQNSLSSLEIFLTCRIWHMVAIFFCHGILLHHQWECNYTFPICRLLIMGKQGHNYIWQWKYECTARASQSIQESSHGILLDWQIVVCMYLLAFFSETDTPSFSHDRNIWLIPKALPISTMGGCI